MLILQLISICMFDSLLWKLWYPWPSSFQLFFQLLVLFSQSLILFCQLGVLSLDFLQLSLHYCILMLYLELVKLDRGLLEFREVIFERLQIWRWPARNKGHFVKSLRDEIIWGFYHVFIRLFLLHFVKSELL